MPKRTARFHIRKARNGQYRPYLKAANGEIVGGSETYHTLAGAKKWVGNMALWVGDAEHREIIIDK
jgi:uncharacterized protein YegP (UPF0339 family)